MSIYINGALDNSQNKTGTINANPGSSVFLGDRNDHPFDDFIVIQIQGDVSVSGVTLLDMTGKIMFAGTYSGTDQKEIIINTGNISQGLYICKIVTNNEILAVKLMCN